MKICVMYNFVVSAVFVVDSLKKEQLCAASMSSLILAWTGGCFTNVPRALQNNLAKINHAGNHIYGENFKLKLCTGAQSVALGTRTKFQREILTRSMISAIHTFRENVLESSRNVSETTPRLLKKQLASDLRCHDAHKILLYWFT